MKEKNRKKKEILSLLKDTLEHNITLKLDLEKLQSKKMLGRELTNISGIGEKKANALLKHFGSMSKIKNASAQSLIEVKGISEQNAINIVEYFNKL